MKLLVATNRGQGKKPGDFTWVMNGEVLCFPVFECSTPEKRASCGCDRCFDGILTMKGTTTAEVEEIPEWTREQLVEAWLDGLTVAKWIKDAKSRREWKRDLDKQAVFIETFCAPLAPGTVVERHAGGLRVRAMAALPSQRQLAALHEFAAANGRIWKSNLNACWQNGNYQDFPGTGQSHLLQQIRNTFGPSWLVRYKRAV